jgi:hypothetical protein
MALVVKDRVQESTTTTGTGTLTLNGAVFGFQTFAIIGDGNVTYYAITDPGTGSWEVGIGTYTASGTTLSRTTVFESSNSGSLVDFAAGTKNVFCTYPAERAVYLDAAGSAVTLLDVGTLGASTANITTANITSGTITTTPVNNTDIVNKEYADAIASGIHFHEAVAYATTAALPACTYNNGTSGVGATLTGDVNGALTIDGHTFTSPTDDGTRVLIKNQANGAHNGVYTLTQAGNSSPGAPFILTRATDFDTVGTGVDQIDEGDFFLVTSGTANVNTAWVQQTAPPITIGTTAIVFQQFSAPITYTAGTGLSESPTYTFNIANTGTAGTYGSASNVPVFVTNAQGQVTSVTNTGIAISSAAVSGLAASATTDTTNASNITSGTLGTSRLSGSYTGVTGVGTLTAGTWNATAIGAVYGGTGLTSYAVGDLLYANTTTSLAKLADVAVGNALISGGVAAAPSWGKIGLATHVDGTLPVANGGTGNTTNTATNLSGGTVSATTGSFSGVLTAPKHLVNRSAGQASGIAWYDNTYSAWTDYMSPAAATSCGPYGNITAPSGTLVTSWGLRRFIENASGYGWTWESGTSNQVTPTVVAEIRASDGAARFAGTVTAPTFSGNATTATNLSTTRTNWSTNGTITAVVGQLAWKNYGNSHTIFDASASTAPDGTSVNNTNSQVAWTGTYPTLMGWNGANTYGVRVDSARLADNGIPAGTVMLFVQTAAPTGWTKSTAHDNKALRIVSGTASSGGSVAFTTAFASQAVSGSVGNTTLAVSQIPGHTHNVVAAVNAGGRFTASGCTGAAGSTRTTDAGTGGNGAHNHTFSGTAINLAVQYVDAIIATKA